MQPVKRILAVDKHLSHSRVLLLGFTFKENVADVHNTKATDIVRELQSYLVSVNLVDPYAETQVVIHEYPIEMKPQPEGTNDAIIVAVAHHECREKSEPDF